LWLDLDAPGPSSPDAILKTIVDAKGDQIVASAADTVVRVPVSTDGYVWTADSAEAAGVKWAPPAGSGIAVTASSPPTGGSDGQFAWDTTNGVLWRNVAGTWKRAIASGGTMPTTYSGLALVDPFNPGFIIRSTSTLWTFSGGLTTSWNFAGLTNAVGNANISGQTAGTPHMYGVFTINTLPVGGTISFGVGNQFTVPNPFFTVNSSGQITSSETGSTVLATVPALSILYVGAFWGAGAFGIYDQGLGRITAYGAVSGSSFSPIEFGLPYGQKGRVWCAGTLSAGSVTPVIEVAYR
jgi:hypothetical protein